MASFTWPPQQLTAGSGTVTSVALSDASTSPIFGVSGSPVTTSGTLTLTLSTQTANRVFAGPSSGSAAQPGFRALVAADLPLVSLATGITGNLAVTHLNSGTGATSSTFWRGDGTWAAAGGGSATWGGITGSSAQEVPTGGFDGLAAGLIVFNSVGGNDDGRILVTGNLGTLSGVEIKQLAAGNARITNLDSGHSLTLAATGGGTVILGDGPSYIQMYNGQAYGALSGSLFGATNNTSIIGGTVGDLSSGRMKDGSFGTSLRTPLYTDIDANTAGDPADVVVRGVTNAGAGRGGHLSLTGGTGGGPVGIVNTNAAAGSAYQYDTPSAGGTVTIGAGVSVEVVDPAGTLATLTVTLPANAVDQQRIRIGCSQIVTALTLNGSGGDTVSNALGSFAAGGTVEYIYRLANTTWFRIG